MNEAYRKLIDKLSVSERLLITSLFFDTARDIIEDNAPEGLSENQLRRYVYERMYKEPAPPGRGPRISSV
jgi:hypothetical protein